jgi:hypothetical protein
VPIYGKLLNQDWLDLNASRAYPLNDGAGETDITGTFKLPRELIVDFVFPVDVSLALDPAGFYISAIAIYGNGLTLTFAHIDGGTFASVSLSSVSHVPDTNYAMTGIGLFAGMNGRVTIGQLTETLKSGGKFTFALSATRLLPTLLPPDIAGVRSITALNGASSTSKLMGDVIISAGRNCRIGIYPGSSTLRIDALNADDFNADCGNSAILGPPIRTINSVPPDVNGNFQFIPTGTCMQITSGGAATLSFKDACSEPCCGTPELEELQTDLNNLNADALAIKGILEAVEQHLGQLDALSVVLSTLATTGGS